MIAIMALFVFELVIISGDVYSDAYNFQLRAIEVLDQGVDQYQRGGYLDFKLSNFSIRLSIDNTTMRQLKAESKLVNLGGSFRNYTDLFFASDDYVSYASLY
jgi:hypothetical protein